MKLSIFQIDAFADRPFVGNPAAIVPLDRWLPDETMQAIAMENNLAETAFFVPEGPDFGLRWFTPAIEVDLCGHATLASGALVLERLDPTRQSVTFHTRSGPLTVARSADGLFEMNLPANPPTEVPVPEGIAQALGGAPVAMMAAAKLMAVYDDPDFVRRMSPDLGWIAALPYLGLIVTAQGDGDFDFVSRFFAPAAGIPEDPVTGSAHVTLAPYWGQRLGTTELSAFQASPRGGQVRCRLAGDRVFLSGRTVLYLEGSIHV